LNGYLRLIEQKDGDLDLRYIDIELVYQNRFKETPFHSLCRNQRNLMVEYFLNNGLGNPNIYCSAAGLTPLHLAVAVSIINDNTETLDILLRNGGDLLKRTKKG
jgi:ankyrin repeat protein